VTYNILFDLIDETSFISLTICNKQMSFYRKSKKIYKQYTSSKIINYIDIFNFEYIKCDDNSNLTKLTNVETLNLFYVTHDQELYDYIKHCNNKHLLISYENIPIVLSKSVTELSLIFFVSKKLMYEDIKFKKVII